MGSVDDLVRLAVLETIGPLEVLTSVLEALVDILDRSSDVLHSLLVLALDGRFRKTNSEALL